MRVIDAEAVIQKLEELQARRVADGSLLAGATHQIIQWCIDIIMQQPTAETEKRGAWVEDICCDDLVMCNACGNEAYFNLDKSAYVLFDYCPWCGTKMDAEVKQG